LSALKLKTGTRAAADKAAAEAEAKAKAATAAAEEQARVATLRAALEPHLTLDAAKALVATGADTAAALAALSGAEIRERAGLALLPAKRLQAAAKDVAAKEAAEAKAAEEAAKSAAEAPIRATLDSSLVDLLDSNDLLLEVGPILIKEEVTTLQELEELSAEDLQSVRIKRASSCKLKGQDWVEETTEELGVLSPDLQAAEAPRAAGMAAEAPLVSRALLPRGASELPPISTRVDRAMAV